MSRIAILGAGVMGGALLSALLRSQHAPEDIVLSERMVATTRDLVREYAVVSAPVEEAARGAGVVVLAVKPQDMPGLLAQIHDCLSADTLVISVAAGISTGYLENRLPEGTGVVRLMPTRPCRSSARVGTAPRSIWRRPSSWRPPSAGC